MSILVYNLLYKYRMGLKYDTYWSHMGSPDGAAQMEPMWSPVGEAENECEETVKLLGVEIDSHLKFDMHISAMCVKGFSTDQENW